MNQTSSIPFTCGHCGRPIGCSQVWLGGSPYHPECTHGPDYKPETFQPIPVPAENDHMTVTVKMPPNMLAELLNDKERLDFLEAEMDREQERIADNLDPGVSLFRQCEPITRRSIDKARRK